MPSNKGARRDIRFHVSSAELKNAIANYNNLKQQEVRTVFREVGNLYKKTLMSKIPDLGFNDLNKIFRFNTSITKNNITLVAGILDKSQFEENKNYLRFWLYGTKRHWVSLKHKEVLTWGLRNGSIVEENGEYYSAKTGKKITAITVQNRPHINLVIQIQNEMLKELIYRLERLGGN